MPSSVVSREVWGAQPRRGSATPWSWSEVKGICVHHSAGNTPADHSQCAAVVRGIQSYQMSLKDSSGDYIYRDIEYNAVICRHGSIFEGRWFGDTSGANGTGAANRQWFAVCYLGRNPGVTKRRVDALRYLMARLATKNPSATSVTYHSRFVSTACPGNRWRNWIKAGHHKINCKWLAGAEKAALARLEWIRQRQRKGRC